MGERLSALPEEKRRRIINAGFWVFSRYEYRRAITDDIAAAAGISKGLLFHYFGNKKSLYAYLYRCAIQFVTERITVPAPGANVDFFDLLTHSLLDKLTMMEVHPHVFDFLMRAYRESDPAVSDVLAGINAKSFAAGEQLIMTSTDLTKFKPGAPPEQVLKLILWAAEGAMQSRAGDEADDIKRISAEFIDCLGMLRQNVYREEWLCTPSRSNT